MAVPTRHILTATSFSAEEFQKTLDLAIDIKANPQKYAGAMNQKTLLMLFQKPSLRTRVSFETGMTKMGGHAIFYSVADSPLGAKETIADTAHVLERMVDVVMARLNKRADIRELAANSKIPIINALDDFAHPCQMIADFQTILEKRGTLKGTVLSYFGDVANNVTYDLMRTCALFGLECHVCGPADTHYAIEKEVIDECEELNKKTGGKLLITHDVAEACKGTNVVYTDTIISYHIPKEELPERRRVFKPFQVTKELMAQCEKDCIFMHCLPAARGDEVTAEVIDGPQSVIFDEAENRMWAQMALLIHLIYGFK
ncbi:ornithine carbamoyltransferase family protein [Trichomonas vaginalis G3]|uniref:ornithine carbamoyltransferase n=1 Tax=Trichomonas vaginalis (strain ATCC PRA-98 / G3) TaxID=412133 RepID=A2EUY0_TRIV3|nr:ornithine carbamoyltransferase protein [Trichomonas vaginalis G3]EAY03503.1 ornithine carbamoyltransferase family protein [Trichomonas vaginalis G3]KAI5537462.1 ornithine carbamoyltransferase protein [Trichomonas vaginalis G3]|eukprot:XP_001315726.1 ornithine carbamoyltransferase family protein [Trichomonas vaginalis G3]